MQCPHHLILVHPRDFAFNVETSKTNAFQQEPSNHENVNQLARQEFEALCAILTQHQISYTVFDSPALVTVPDAVFPNNWFAVLPYGQLVVFPMCNTNRREEVNEQLLEQIQERFEIKILLDLLPYIEKQQYLEGTGSIVFDHDEGIAYACVSPRTNIPLLEYLCQLIGYKPVSFLAEDLKGQPIYHTNVVMSIGTSTAVVCLECIPDLIERNMVKQFLILSHKRVIEISFDQLNHFCANILLVKNKVNHPVWLMSSTAFKAFEPSQIKLLEEDGEIVSASLPVIERVGGGSLRCMLAGIHAVVK